MSDFVITEYRELVKNAQIDAFHEHEFSEEPEEFVITFIEDPDLGGLEDEELVDSTSFLEPPKPEDISEYFETDTDELIDFEDREAMPFRLPGAPDYVDDDFEEEDEEEEEETVTDWENDRDPQHFMQYILSMYPSKIPSHSGKSTLGCEKAVLFLTNLNKEISEALRSENADQYLDLDVLEDIRVRMTRDIVKLKEHSKKLNKMNKKVKKKADEEISITKNSEINSEEFKKEATTAKIQMIMTPFQRAITGIILNSTISAGKPFEQVYDFLKKKYKIDDREELEILQLLMDMGQPIFKDRGTIGDEDHDEEGHGVDFMKNYFA